MSDLKPLAGSLENGGVAHFWRDSAEGGEIVTVQDVAPILERNLRLRNETDGYNKDRTLRHIGTIPNGLITKWLVEEGLDVWKPEHGHRVAKKLNDPDFSDLRASTGRLGLLKDGGFR